MSAQFSLPRMRGRVGVGAAQPLLLLVLVLLAACGRTGDIRPPGPPEQITYPRVYPAR
ncbi:lipoprotein [Falsiroseomonas bella]|uniref:lipoprotein n=1 Tax=Falsiroseomonas bella TaxID=2184016 RepID=UPI001304BEC4|nr:lipoprotein [Falsiroseomonas bella]